MSLQPYGPDEFGLLTEQVRQHNTAKIKDVLAALEPYVDGSFGQINPAHVRAYLEALKGLGNLWRVYEKPEVRPDEVDEQAAAELTQAAARQRVLEELAKLRELHS